MGNTPYILMVAAVLAFGKLLPQKGLFPFNKRSMAVFGTVIVVFVLWFYWTYNINITISYDVDNYLNYRSMWGVR